MTFATEFPDYPAKDMPTIPPGFVDTSWHNNSAPSFANDKFSVWVDYADESQREYPGGKRFAVNEIDADGAFKSDWPDFETDDWDEVLRFVASH